MYTQIVKTFPFVSDYDVQITEIIRQEMKDIMEHCRLIPRIRADNKKMWNRSHHERKIMIDNIKNHIATYQDTTTKICDKDYEIAKFTAYQMGELQVKSGINYIPVLLP